MRQSMTYGTLPTREVFDATFDLCVKASGYRIQLGSSDSRACDGFKLGDGAWTADQLWDAITEIVNSEPDEITIEVTDDEREDVYEVRYQDDVWPFYCEHYTARATGFNAPPFLEIGPDDDGLIDFADKFGTQRQFETSREVNAYNAVAALNYASAYRTVGHDYARKEAAMDIVDFILETLGFEWV